MKLHASNETCFALAESGYRSHKLYCISKYGTVAAHELPGHVTGLLLHGDKLLCLAEHQEKKYEESIVLHTFDTKLQEISSKRLADGFQSFQSAMDSEYIYILGTDTASVDFGGDMRSCDEVCALAFIKINIATGERMEWTLEDADDNICHDTLIDLTNGYVTGVTEIHAFDGKILFTCDVYDPGSEIVCDDSDFDENELDDCDYVEWHSFPEMFCADVDAQKFSSIDGFDSNIGEFHLKRSLTSHNERILNLVSTGTKTYIATEHRFLCMDARNRNSLVMQWYHMGLDPAAGKAKLSEQYRHFYVWGDELIFENRNKGTLTGFRLCPAQLDEPKAAAWRTIELEPKKES